MILERDLRRTFEQYRVLQYQDLILQIKRPVPEKKKRLPAFNEATYKKRYANDFTVFFEDEAALKAFLRKKYNRELKETREYNLQIEKQNKIKLEEWEREKKAVGTFYRQYANREAEGVEWFFRQVIGNIPHAFYNGDVFDCEYLPENSVLKAKYVFPDTARIFEVRNEPSQIRSISDPAFKPYYFSILILMIRVLFTAVYKNDLKKVVDQLHLKGSFSHCGEAKASSETVFYVEINSRLNRESLKKIHEMRPEDLMTFQMASSEPAPDNPNPVQSADHASSTTLNEECFSAFKERLLQGLQHLSKLEAIITGSVGPKAPPATEEVQEDQEKYTEIIQKVNDLPGHLMRAFEKVLLLKPAEKHPLSSINITKLGSLQLVNRLMYRGIPLIKLTGTKSDLFIWGENFPEELIDELRRQFLKEGESVANGH